MTTKILALTDALGCLVRFVLLPGQRHDLQGVDALLEGIDLQALLADKAFDADWLKQRLLAQGCQVVMAQKTNRRAPLAIDMEVYKWRHLIENFFCKLKEFKRIALRSDKTDSSFAAVITLASAAINSRQISTGPRKSWSIHQQTGSLKHPVLISHTTSATQQLFHLCQSIWIFHGGQVAGVSMLSNRLQRPTQQFTTACFRQSCHK